MNLATPQHPFDIFPAIDLLDGQSVRLRQGARESAYIVNSDPTAQISGYAAAGARWVHIVNLNAAFGDAPDHPGAGKSLATLRQLIAWRQAQNDEPAHHNRILLQVGGGVRSADMATELFAMGMDRIVIGTWALRDPESVCALARDYPGRVVVGLDTRGGELTSDGWTKAMAELPLVHFGRRLFEGGVRVALCTTIERDGMLSGADVSGVQQLAKETGLRVLASGGVASADDVRRLAAAAPEGVAGVIIGAALHAGRLTLSEALKYQSPGRAAPSTSR